MSEVSPAPAVVITGGEGDLARAIAGAFTGAGWQVRAPGRRELDVTSPGSVSEYFAGLPGATDLLVNNAGGLADGPAARMTPGDWDAVLGPHLDGAWRCCRAAARGMVRRRRGHLVQIGSYGAMHGPAGQANYAAAKSALVGLTRSLARELGPRNVRANLVLPGWLDTRMTAPLSPAVREHALRGHALGRLNTCADVARFLLALHALEHVSGQVFQLDSRIGPGW